MGKDGKKTGKRMAPTARDYTLNLGKLTCKVQFKKRATRAVRSIRKYAAKVMNTKDVRYFSIHKIIRF